MDSLDFRDLIFQDSSSAGLKTNIFCEGGKGGNKGASYPTLNLLEMRIGRIRNEIKSYLVDLLAISSAADRFSHNSAKSGGILCECPSPLERS